MPTSRAVRVETHRDEAGGNGIATFLLKFAGFDAWNVRTVSVFETCDPPCLREGCGAENMVDIQSNNSCFNGFRIHSDDVVSIDSSNCFEAGTIVSMPDSAWPAPGSAGSALARKATRSRGPRTWRWGSAVPG